MIATGPAIVGASLITAGAGGASSAVSAGRSKKSQRRAQKYSNRNRLAAQAYNTEMSNTAYQRSAADMKAAGLNPMMMYGGMGAPSAPQSSAASGAGAPSADMAGIDRGISSAVATIMEGKRIKALQDQTKSNVALNKEKQNTERTQQTKNKMSVGPLAKLLESEKLMNKVMKKSVKTTAKKLTTHYKQGQDYQKQWHGKKVPISRKK